MCMTGLRSLQAERPGRNTVQGFNQTVQMSLTTAGSRAKRLFGRSTLFITLTGCPGVRDDLDLFLGPEGTRRHLVPLFYRRGNQEGIAWREPDGSCRLSRPAELPRGPPADRYSARGGEPDRG